MFRNHHNTTTRRNTRPTFWTRLKGPNASTRTYKTDETTYGTGHRHHGTGYGGPTTTSKTAPPRTTATATGAGMTTHHHHRRRPSIGDRVSGAMLKLKGSLTRRPGVKAAGTRRMRGTDGRGSRNRYAY